MAHGLAAEGAHLVLAARDAGRLGEAAAAVRDRHGVRAIGVPCDAATAEGTATLVAAAEQDFGGADILVNNAGTGSNETIMEAPDEKWQYYWDLHVMAAAGSPAGSSRRCAGAAAALS